MEPKGAEEQGATPPVDTHAPRLLAPPTDLKREGDVPEHRSRLENTTFTRVEVLNTTATPTWEDRRGERRKNAPTPSASVKKADAIRTCRGRPQWRVRLEAEAMAAGTPPTDARADVVRLTLVKGRAGHQWTPDARMVREALTGTETLTPEQEWALAIYLQEARTEGLREAWLNGEVNLADVARRGVELYGREVLIRVPGVEVITRETTGTGAWKS